MKFIRISFDSLGSTNTEAAARARAGAPEGTVITACQQSTGRGRQGRAWLSPAGNLYASFILRPSVPPPRVGELSFVAALAVGETVGAFGADWRLKWPNDVLVRGAKISGLLLEREDGGVVLGIGLNVVHAPAIAGRTVTSLAAEGGDCGVSVDDVLACLQDRLDHHYTCWLATGFASVREAWLARAEGVGQPVRAVLATGEVLEGRFHGLREDGALLIAQAADRLIPVTSADVFFVASESGVPLNPAESDTP